ncbi:periplasmic binding protein-like II [Piromyces finnis]|uniref:Periplasmic binding protein-like II n=1 Tax=Piromyces finnis TaxID=1754191 RepID=A0A1Y1UWE7_9FUNG|nr:periplasmic binding protein-like II [Piromyces finnis]|eukprot:ORX42464.1 periplasmic binding protein-like II [Piromyces finnis]
MNTKSRFNAIEITIHGFLYSFDDPLYQNLEKTVNEHFKKIGKDITIKASFGDGKTSSPKPEDIAEAQENFIPKKKNKYSGADLYIIDTVNTGRFAKHFEDLNERMSEEVLSYYREGTATKTCIMNDRLVGLPYHIDYAVMIANQSLLDKYNKPYPKTWEELIETENYIYNQEIKVNKRLHRYIGHFDEIENGAISFLEFIHSYRDDPNDGFPSYTSENAIKALEEMKRVKQMASNDDDFKGSDNEVFPRMTCTDFIFLRQFYLPLEIYDFIRASPEIPLLEWCGSAEITPAVLKAYPIPGKKPGISASGIGGNSISMSRYISEEKKKAATEILNFIFSYEEQKYNSANYGTKTAIHALYKEPEVCKKIDCEFFSSMQGIVRPSSEAIDYKKYKDKIYELVFNYIYERNNKSAKEVLIELDNIRKIHYIEYLSVAGILILGFTFLTAVLIFSSYIYVSIKRFRNQFVFLPFNYWCIIILGIFIMSCYCLTGIQKLNNYNCLIRPILLSIGFSMIYIPILLKMISIFPSKNNLSKYVKDHFGFVFMIFIIIDIGMNIAWYLLDPLLVSNVIVEGGRNFQTCTSSGKIGNIIQYALYIIKIIIIIVMCVLVFAEWNLAAFRSDIRSVAITLYTNLLIIGMFIIIGKINIDNLYLHFGIKAGLVLILCLSTLIIIIGSKTYQISFKKNEAYPDITSFKNSTTGMNSSRFYSELNSTTQMSSNKINLFNYHYQTGNGVMKPNPTLFSATINSSYNEFSNIDLLYFNIINIHKYKLLININ